MIPLDKAKIVVESWKDIVIGFNGDPYRGRSRSVPSQKGYKSAKCGRRGGGAAGRRAAGRQVGGSAGRRVGGPQPKTHP